jgi:HEAT repeat protein
MAVAAGPRLVQALRDPEPTVRIASAATLGALRVHRREATEALRAGLRHGDAAVRNRTLGALSAPTGADLFPELVRAARSDPDSNLRTAAVGALWYGGEQAVPVLIPFLRHPNADVRNAAVQSLRNLGPKARLAVPYLLADLDSCAGQGVQALADIRDADAVPRLIELLAHRDLRGTALSALQTIGPDAHAALPRLLEVLDEQADLRTQALQAILTIGANDENVMAALERRVLTEFAARRDDLVWPFCQNSDRAHVLVPALIKRLREDVPKSCVAHVQALGAIGSPARDAVPVLLRFGREVNYELRSSAINALCSIAAGEREVVPWLIEQLDHDQHADSAVSALAQFGARAESARPHLLPFLKSARPEWRSAAISALAAIGPPEVVAEDLMPLLRDREESVRITASQALCSLGPTNQLEQVIALLRDEQPAVRNAVARALRDLGPSAAAAVPALSALLDDDSQTTFDTALEALARIEP